MDGFLIVDKPAGITSHDVVAFARRRLKTKKIGHTGTLDPLATGLLVLGVGLGTRLIEYLVGCDKEYEAEIFFGATSSTCDADGEIKQNLEAQAFTKEELEKVLPKFIGQIFQIPPKHSAIKISGKAAYERARAGESFEMKAREVKIHSIEIVKFAYPNVELKISCGSGTYIRSIARDLGEQLNTGAYLSKLKRTKVGNFGLTKTIPMKSIRPEKLLPLEAGVRFKHLNLTRLEAEKIRVGQKITCREGNGCDNFVAGFFEGHLLAVLEHEKTKNTLKPVKVFMRGQGAEKKTVEFEKHKIGGN